ncbi:MAG: hypothetical protein ABEJ90_04470 [Halobacterium sp.]
MTRGSEFLLYLLFLGPFALVVLVLLFAGPVGWVLAAFLVLGGMTLRALLEDDGDGSPERTVCPACGSPSAGEKAECPYCGESR